MFIKTQFPEEPGTVLDLRLVLFGTKFHGAAEVVWLRGYDKGPDEPCGMGVKFLDLTPSQKKMLYREIDTLLKQGARMLVGTPPQGGGRTEGEGKSKPKRRTIWSFLNRS